MKNNLKIGILVVGALMLMSSTCSSDDDSNSNNNVNVQELTNISTDGTWMVTSFVEDGNDETYHFDNFIFSFNADGSLTAVNDPQIITGMWSITDDSSNDDDSYSDKDFVIMFNVDETSNFEDLNDDWDIENYTANKIQLIDVSGGDGSVDTLVIEKN